MLRNLWRSLLRALFSPRPVRQVRRAKPRLGVEMLEERCMPSTTWFVNEYASGQDTGQNWANAFTSLQTALADAQAGDQIWVAAGVYKPTIAPDPSATFALKEGVAIYGGFSGGETELSQRNWTANLTILSGGIGSTPSADSWHVVTGDDVDSSAVLDGFTISGGYAGQSSNEVGGGIYLSAASPTLQNLTIEFNFAQLEGGGLINLGGSPTLTNVDFNANQAGTQLPDVTLAGAGGGMYEAGTATLTNVVFHGNTAGQGGGLFDDGNFGTLTNVIFDDNYAYFSGGGIYWIDSNLGNNSLSLTNADFYGNTALGQGGAIYADDTGVVLTNAIVWNNSAPAGPEFYLGADGGPTATISATYSDIEGGFTGAGNISADPLFVNPADENFQLQPGSPAIESGTDVGAPSFDIVGDPRLTPDAGPVDMGAYEFQKFSTATAVTSTDLTETLVNESKPLHLSASVTAPGEVVSGGSVSFLIVAPDASVVADLPGNLVVNGAAAATYTPDDLQAGTYSIEAVYNPIAVGSSFLASDDTSDGTLTIASAGTVTTVPTTPIVQTFSDGTQQVQLSANVAPAANVAGLLVNEGTVNFAIYDASNNLVGTVGGVPVANGQAAISFPGLPVGTYHYQAIFVAAALDASFLGSMSGTDGTIDIDPDSTVTSVACSVILATASPSSQPVTFTASVQPGNLADFPPGSFDTVNEGTVTFTLTSLGGSLIATLSGNAVVQGSASAAYDLAGLPAGDYLVHAVYVPAAAGDFTASADATDVSFGLSAVPIDNFSAAGTTTAVTSSKLSVIASANPQPVTLSAAVTSGGGLVSGGTVTFTLLDSAGNTVATLSGVSVNGGTAAVSFTPTALPAGNYHIHAAYDPGNSDFTASADAVDGTLAVVLQATTTTVTSTGLTVSFSNAAQAISVAASVVPTGGSPGETVNTGTVTFTLLNSNHVQIGSSVVVNNTTGQVAASLTLPANTPVGVYYVHAVYAAGGTPPIFAASADASDGAIHVEPVAPLVEFDDTGLVAIFTSQSRAVTLSASLFFPDMGPQASVNDGTITFGVYSAANVLVGQKVTAAVTAGTGSASYVLPAGLPTGAYQVEAVFTPAAADPNFLAGSSLPLPLNVLADATTTKVTSAVVGTKSVTVTAAVTPGLNSPVAPGNTVNQGSVNFSFSGANGLITELSAPVVNGQASANLSTSGLVPGQYTVTASYSPALNPEDFNASADTTGVSFTIVPASTTTVITSASAIKTFSSGDQFVPLAAAVTDAAGQTVNEGTVTFALVNSAGTTILSSAGNPVAGGTAAAQLDIANVPAGIYQIEASYVPQASNPNFQASKAAAGKTLTVHADSTAISVSTIAQAVTSSQSEVIVLYATVRPGNSAAAGAIYQGTVTFTVFNSSNTAVATLTSVEAINDLASTNFDLKGLPAGVYHVHAAYVPASQAANFTASQDASDATFTLAALPTVTTAPSSTVTRVASTGQVVELSAGPPRVFLSAIVTSSTGGLVNQGSVNFALVNQSNQSRTSINNVLVVNGSAQISITTPLAAGSYEIEAAYVPVSQDPAFTASTATAGTLLVVAPMTTTTVTSTGLKLAFAPASEQLPVSALVAAAGGMPQTGTATFSILNASGTQIASASITNNDGNGNFSGSVSLPAGLAPGIYFIHAVYSDPNGIFTGSTDVSNGTLQIVPATVSVTQNSGFIIDGFSNLNRTVTIEASVTPIPSDSQSGPVNQGTVTFSGLGETVTAPVAGGIASVNFSIPANTPAGLYFINLTYHPAAGDPGYQAGAGSGQVDLGIADDDTATTFSSTDWSASYSTNTQTLPVVAKVAVLSRGIAPAAPGTSVNQGSVAFEIVNSQNVVIAKAVSAAVNGTASANLILPAGLPIGQYRVTAQYSDGVNLNFAMSAAPVETLSVNADGTTIVSTLPAITRTFTTSPQGITFSAAVKSPSGRVVNEGTVTFNVVNATGQTVDTYANVPVSAGLASYTLASFQLPPAGSYAIVPTYVPIATDPTFTGSTATAGSALVVMKAGTTTILTTSGQTRTYSTAPQSVIFSAMVMSAAGGNLSEGTATFTLLNAGGQVVQTSANNAVRAGSASASFNLANLPAGNYHVHVTYVPATSNADFTASSDASDVSVVILKDSTTTAVSSTGLTAVFSTGHQLVKLSATVTPGTSGIGSMVNEGTVTFSVLNDAGAVVATLAGNPVSADNASVNFDLASLPAGNYGIIAAYRPASTGPDFISSSGVANSALTVKQDSTSVAAANVTATFSNSSEQIALHAAVTPGNTAAGGTVNEGSVTFEVVNSQGTQIGAAVTSGTVSAGQATAMFTLPAGTPVGQYFIQTTYNPIQNNPDFTASSDASQTQELQVLYGTTTKVTSTAVTQPFSNVPGPLAVSVSVISPMGGAVNGGSVSIIVKVNGQNAVFGSPLSVSNGVASGTMGIPAIPVGTYQILAQYSGSSTFAPSSDLVGGTLTITKDSTSVTVSSSTDAVTYGDGQTVTVSAQVIPGPTTNSQSISEGTVTFTVLNSSNQVFVTIPNVSVQSGAASAVLPNLPAGLFHVQAAYVPAATDPNFTASSDTQDASLNVKTDSTSIVLSGNLSVAVLSTQSTPVQFTAAVTSFEGTVVNEGSVTFIIYNSNRQVAATLTGDAVSNGKASVTYNASNLPTGYYQIGAVYVPRSSDPDYTGSTTFEDFMLQVLDATTTTVTSSPLSSVFTTANQPVALSAKIASPLNVAVNGGTLTFNVVNASGMIVAQVQSAAVSQGIAAAMLNLADLSVGSYHIHAVYSGSPDAFDSSMDNSGTTLTIAAAATTTSPTLATALIEPFSNTGTNVTFVGQVSSATGPVDGGTFTFVVVNSAGVPIGQPTTSGVVADGQASAIFTVPAGTALGQYTIETSYSGNANFEASLDNAGILQVSPILNL